MESSEFKTALQKALTALSDTVRPPPDLLPSEWADENRVLSPEGSAESGRWRTSRTPHLRGIMDAAKDPTTKEIAVISPSQQGKSETLLNLIGYFIDHDPSPMLLLEPTLEMAEAFSKDRIAPMIRDTKCLRSKVGDVREKKSNSTIRHKVFPGGHLTMCGANSAASLAMRPIRVLLADEVNRYPKSAGKEGDPLKLASKRTLTFWNSLKVYVSSPTTRGSCKINDLYTGSSEGKFCLLCPDCDAPNFLDRSHIIVKKTDQGKVDEVLATCKDCGAVNGELAWKSREGVWVHKDPKNPVKGFWMKCYSGTFQTWKDIELEFLDCKDDPEKLQVYTNTVLAEMWEEKGEQASHEKLYDRRENYKLVPERACIITTGVDVQADRLELETVAWGDGDESWNLDYRVFRGDTTQGDYETEGSVWYQLAQYIEHKKFDHQLGDSMGVTVTAIDMNYNTEHVLKFVRSMAPLRVIPVRGKDGQGNTILKEGKTKIGKTNIEVKFWNVGVDQVKLWLMRRLDMTKPGSGYCHFPLARDQEYFEGLTSEKLIRSFKDGVAKEAWKKTRARNEPLDCRVYAYAAVRWLNPVYEVIQKRHIDKIKTTPPDRLKKPVGEPQVKRRRVVRRGVLSKGVRI